MDAVAERVQLNKRIANLLAKPRRNRVDEAELDRLQRKLRDNLMRVGRPPGGGTNQPGETGKLNHSSVSLRRCALILG